MTKKTHVYCSNCIHNGWCKYQKSIDDIKKVIENTIVLDPDKSPFSIQTYCDGYRDHDI